MAGGGNQTSGVPDDNGDNELQWGGREEWSGALTLAMGEEVVSERGGGAGVTISGAHTVTAQGGAELLHSCQSLCRMEGFEMGDKEHRDQAAKERRTYKGINVEKRKQRDKVRDQGAFKVKQESDFGMEIKGNSGKIMLRKGTKLTRGCKRRN